MNVIKSVGTSINSGKSKFKIQMFLFFHFL